jgi:hypothetical protein
LTQPVTTADITATNITVSGVTAGNKVYDGTNDAILNTGSMVVVGVIPGDVVSLITTGAIGKFVNKNVANGKTVSTSGFTMDGADAANYTLTQPVTTDNIIEANTTVSGVKANNKVYDGNTTATLSGVASLSGILIQDIVVLNGTPVATFASPEIADNIPVNVTGYTISGVDAINYTLTQPESLKANITITTGIKDIKSEKLSYSLYPNPTSDFVTLKIENYNNEKLSYILFDSRGKILENKQIFSNETQIQMQNLYSGTYFIGITNNKNDVKTIKIIKN